MHSNMYLQNEFSQQCRPKSRDMRLTPEQTDDAHYKET